MAAAKKRGRPKGPEKRDGQKRLTIWLPSERARLVKACAEYHGLELGQVMDRGVDAALAGFYVAHRGSRPPSPAAEPTAETGAVTVL
jgi:hypothetical protein